MKKFLVETLKSFAYFLTSVYFRCKNKNVRIGRSCRLRWNDQFDGYNKIGNNVLFHGNLGLCSYIGSDGYINARIGNFCSIGNNVKVLYDKHPTQKFVSTSPVFFSTERQCGLSFVDKNRFEEHSYIDTTKKIACIIGNDVWIGSDVIILGGIEIGDGAIVAAGAVVTKNVPPFCIVAGVPARVIKKRFSDSEIEFLMQFQWWKKPLEWLRNHCEEFQDIHTFIEKNADSE